MRTNTLLLLESRNLSPWAKKVEKNIFLDTFWPYVHKCMKKKNLIIFSSNVKVKIMRLEHIIFVKNKNFSKNPPLNFCTLKNLLTFFEKFPTQNGNCKPRIKKKENSMREKLKKILFKKLQKNMSKNEQKSNYEKSRMTICGKTKRKQAKTHTP